uniref:Uncharacterized protein n=1 Tax=Avena sativa TaxID=4498 RepID=A0ACD6ADY2_AVESA
MAASMQVNTLPDVANMFTTGLLDDQFHQLQLLQERSTPNFVADVVKLFCEDGEQIIDELAKLLDKPCVDFDKVDAFVHQLGGRSASVGAQRVKNACVQFHEFIQEKSRDGCLKALYALRNDFYDLRNKFQNLLQLEQQVQASYPKQ